MDPMESGHQNLVGNPRETHPCQPNGIGTKWVQWGGCLPPPTPSLVFLVSCPCTHPGRQARAAACAGRRGRTPLCIFLSLHRPTPLDAIDTLPSLSLSRTLHTHRSSLRLRPQSLNNGRCHPHVAATSDLGSSVVHSNSRGLHQARSCLQLCKRGFPLTSVNIGFWLLSRNLYQCRRFCTRILIDLYLGMCDRPLARGRTLASPPAMGSHSWDPPAACACQRPLLLLPGMVK